VVDGRDHLQLSTDIGIAGERAVDGQSKGRQKTIHKTQGGRDGDEVGEVRTGVGRGTAIATGENVQLAGD